MADSSEDDDDIDLLKLLLIRRMRRKKKRVWMHKYLCRRKTHSDFYNLTEEFRLENRELYFAYFGMMPETMDALLGLVGCQLQKMHTQFREPISEKERLALTLRYLATGDSQQTVSFSFRVGRSTVSQIIRGTCNILWNVLMPKYIPTPDEASWRAVARDFWLMWQYPNCLGAIDGKHIRIQAPANSGSEYFNYKHFFSIVLLAVSDAQYRLLAVDIGDAGHHSDSGVLSNSAFGKGLLSGALSIPPPEYLPGTEIAVPHMLIGDEGFPLNQYLMRPYPNRGVSKERRIFNYRLSRARRVVENTFGVMAARWRILHRSIIASEMTIQAVIKAICVLHNFLRQKALLDKKFGQNLYCGQTFTDREDANGIIIPGEWRSIASAISFQDLPRQGSNNHAQSHAAARERLTAFFSSQSGAVSWQNDRC